LLLAKKKSCIIKSKYKINIGNKLDAHFFFKFSKRFDKSSKLLSPTSLGTSGKSRFGSTGAVGGGAFESSFCFLRVYCGGGTLKPMWLILVGDG
jgi:hypothetical protein